MSDSLGPDTEAPSPSDPLAAVEVERIDLCRLLATLDDAQWAAPSLCDEWTVKEVVAHLTTSTRTRVRDMISSIVRARFDFDRAEAVTARRIAQATDSATLVQMVVDHAAVAKHAPGSSTLDQLLDVIVHAQDIARPLGIDHPFVRSRAVPALDHALASRWYGAKQRFAGVRLVASDAEWSSSSVGQILEAPLADLVLLATGRSAGLVGATGAGATVVAERLTA